MRLAVQNVENLFERARAMNLATWTVGRKVLNEYARLNSLFNKPDYSAADKRRILKGLRFLGVLKKDDAGKWVVLRQNRGRLLDRPKGRPVQVKADGRRNWVGWLELKMESVNEIAIQTTAQVIRDLRADVFGVVEADNRVSLARFNAQMLKHPFAHVMLIDGNDERGIDVGVMTGRDYAVASARSHIYDRDGKGKLIFSRDCPEYEIELPSGESMVVMVNHFKSKGYGEKAVSDATRRRQAKAAHDIYKKLRNRGAKLVAVIGDFNDTPDSRALSPLLGSGSDLRDVSEHPNFQSDGRPGTYANGTKSNKIDYMLLSPALFKRVEGASVFRTGVWGGTHGDMWPHYPEMKSPVHAASDHAALWVDLDV